jgi:IS4 transposase
MVDRAWNQGIDASFVLFDSWFAHDKIISSICSTGYGVICRLKRGRVKYGYQGQQYTLKQLWQQVVKKKDPVAVTAQRKGCVPECEPAENRRCSAAVCLRWPQKLATAALCTDLEMDASQIFAYYARRWSIEVFFKDA